MEKIKQVTYSANAISNLNNTQIQNIIDYVISKAVTGDHQTPNNNQINASEAQEQSLDSAEVSKSTPPIPQPMTAPIFVTRHWINILIYIENLVVKISIILELPTRKYAHYAS